MPPLVPNLPATVLRCDLTVFFQTFQTIRHAASSWMCNVPTDSSSTSSRSRAVSPNLSKPPKPAGRLRCQRVSLSGGGWAMGG